MDDKNGLTQKEAKKRLEIHGFNEIKDINKLSALKIFLRQIKNNFIIYLLTAAAIISFFVGKSITAYAILAVIILVTTIGFFQEYKAEKAINALKTMLTPISIVIRDGKEREIPSKEIVPGDVLILRTGERVPVDALVLSENDLILDESILTGESKEVRKIKTKSEVDYKKSNVIFAGTYIVNGRCLSRVLYTGMNTEFGKIAGMISTAEKELPLQKKINNIAKYMTTIALIAALLTGTIILLRAETISSPIMIEALIVAIALAVSAFPEGFPVVLISTLASGAYRMAGKNAIVNRMSIIETLGETTVICSDKTGTITKGEMTVKKILCDNKLITMTGAGYEIDGKFYLDDREISPEKNRTLSLLIKSSILCNNSKIESTGIEKKYSTFGTPTESALLIMGAKAGVFKENIKSERKDEISFNSQKKTMSVFCKEKSGLFVYAKGAPEMLLEKCKYIQRENGIFTLTEKEKKSILEESKKMSSEALRTLAIAYKKTTTSKKELFEKELTLVGLVGMEDPPREDVKEAIRNCYNAGIDVKIITGDNKETALAIARQIKLKKGNIIEGGQLEEYSDEFLVKVVKNAVIFARVKPEHKLRIVKALKQNGEIVTMTGDGVNDAPALKESHIGVAMGLGGTDVTREVADLTLKDDSFSTIVSAIKEGRTIFNNIQKFVTYQLSCNYAEIIIILLAVILGLPLPLIALQILFMNLVTDNLPALTLGFNPSSQDVMEIKARKKSNILTKKLISLIVIAGTIMGILTIGAFYISLNVLNQSLAEARTTALITLIFFEIANAFNFRSFRKKVLDRSPFVNLPLVIASIASIMATLIIIYTPASIIFETTPIGKTSFALAILTSFSIVLVFDVLKKLRGNLNI